MISGRVPGELERHERVQLALDQVNNMKHHYQPPEQKFFELNDLSKNPTALHREIIEEEEENDYDGEPNEDRTTHHISIDDHIEAMLRKTRTLALLNLANNSGALDSDDDDDDEDDEDDEDLEEEDEETQEQGDHPAAGLNRSRRNSRQIGECNDSFSLRQEDRMTRRMSRQLSSLLNLPRKLSTKDLHSITEALLEEHHNKKEIYDDVVDCHLDDGPSDLDLDTPNSLWRRRRSGQLSPLATGNDNPDEDVHQRRLFNEANNLRSVSSKGFSAASSSADMNHGASHHAMARRKSGVLTVASSMRRSSLSSSSMGGLSPNMRHLSSVNVNSHASMHRLGSRTLSKASLPETEDESNESVEVIEDESDLLRAAAEEKNGDADIDGEIGAEDETEYTAWRIQVKSDYLDWIRRKLEAKRKRKEQIRKEKGKKPRWLLLYEAHEAKLQMLRQQEIQEQERGDKTADEK